MIVIRYIAAIVVCLCLSAFFSASEMAYSAANRLRLENAREEGSARAGLACRICERFDDALSAILIGNNLVNIAASSIASVMAISLAGERWTPLFAAVLAVLIIVFGETVPKITAKKNANRLAVALARPVRALTLALRPVVLVVVGLVRLITAPMKGEQPPEDEQEAAVEELQSIIETVEDEGVIDEDRSELLQAALDFSDISASEVMTARVDMYALDIEDDREELLRAVEESPYSRLPVYEDSVDHIIGVLSLNRLLKALTLSPEADVRSMLMEPCYVYKTMKMPAVLDELRRSRIHMAIVTDEYGGTLGIVTMEDVLEQIVGEIWDESDVVEDEVVERARGTWELDGDLSIGEFLELMDWDEDEFETESATVGGWTTEMFGRFPGEGESFRFRDIAVTVQRLDGHRVEQVLVQRDEPGSDRA